MAHMIEKNNDFAFYGQKAWHGLGIEKDARMTAEQAIIEVGADKDTLKTQIFRAYSEGPVWVNDTVALAQYFSNGATIIPASSLPGDMEKGGNFAVWPSEIVDGYYATTQAETGRFLGGIVTDRYEPIQNIEAIRFFESFCDKTEAIIETVGMLKGGAIVFMCAKLPAHITIGGKDIIEKYVVVMFNHDGSGAAKIFMTGIRVVCNNTLRLALRMAQRGRKNEGPQSIVSIRHTISAPDKIKEVYKIMGLQNQYWEAMREATETMTKVKISESQFLKTFGIVYMNDAQVAQLAAESITAERLENYAGSKTANFFGRLMNYRDNGPGQNLWQGTAYNFYNAFTGQVARESYGAKADGSNTEAAAEKRFLNLVGGGTDQKMETIGHLFLNPAKIDEMWGKKVAAGKAELAAAQ